LLAQLAAGLRLVPDKPEETAETTLRALCLAAAGNPVSARKAASHALPLLDDAGFAKLRDLLAQRLAGTPLAYLTGRQQFMGLELCAGPEALIPRAETELLGQVSLDLLRGAAAHKDEPVVLDVCTGSGNLALALAHYVPKARVYAADLSSAALTLAQRNARCLGLESRVEFREGDLLAPFDEPGFQGRVDLLVCNPPYISSGKVATMPHEIIGHEPRLAFDGGALGIRILERLIREAPRFLRQGGFLAFEVGLGQGPALVKRMSAGYSQVRPIEDQAGAVRVIVAQA